jgi:two-component system, NarL family, nitrate/nitrite response regulator NarL
VSIALIQLATTGVQRMSLPLLQTQPASLRFDEKNRRVTPKPSNGQRGLGDSEIAFRVLIVDRDEMSSDLLATRLAQDGGVHATGLRSADLMDQMANGKAQLVVIGSDLNHDTRTGFDLAHTVRRLHPAVPIVMLLTHSSRENVINAFRSGARGVFSRQRPVADFLDCIEHVRRGFIWAGPQETTLLLEAFNSVPSPNMLTASDASPLTMRELQVVKCAARGKTNKFIAVELGLSEHTVKNYLFRAFEKLGVSNRVELLFYLTQRGHTFGTGTEDP